MTASIINADAVTKDFDQINVDILALLARGCDLASDAAVALTADNRAAGIIVAGQPAVPPTPPTLNPATGGLAVDESGSPINSGNPGKPEGWIGPISDDQWRVLQVRQQLLSKLVDLLDKPIGEATISYADMIRAGGRRWSK